MNVEPDGIYVMTGAGAYLSPYRSTVLLGLVQGCAEGLTNDPLRARV